MIRLNLFNLLLNEDLVLNFLLQNNLIKQEKTCNKCGAIKPITSLKNTKCNLRVLGNKCGGETSIFKDTIFERSKIDVQKYIFILYEWSVDTPTDKTAIEYSCNQSTISRLFSEFREIACFFYNIENNETIGGENIIVQIDKTCIVKNKNHNERILSYQKWMISGVVLGNNDRYFIKYVERRDQTTLIDVIRRKIAPRSIIMTDMWGGYVNLASILHEYEFTHMTVNHSNNFINPITGANTQSIESFWSVIKRKFRKKGTNHGNFKNVEKKLIKDLFKKKYKNEIFEKMIFLILIIYS